MRVVEESIPPLLQAARVGSLDSVEWFMSDAPMRRYKEFAEANKHDKRIKTLAESGKGFDKTIGAWLDDKSKRIYFCAHTSSILTRCRRACPPLRHPPQSYRRSRIPKPTRLNQAPPVREPRTPRTKIFRKLDTPPSRDLDATS